MTTVTFRPADAVAGTSAVPPDKSITHRAILLAAISDRRVVIDNPLQSDDTGATLAAARARGAGVEGGIGDGRVVVTGRGVRGLVPPPVIDCMNAGTLMRLVAGILVGQRPGEVTVLDGDDSLRRRPMRRIADPLVAMGAAVTPTGEGTPPVAVRPGLPLHGMVHELPVASAQVKSCVLLAGLNAEGETWVREPVPSRDHTERMLRASGVDVMERDGMVGIAGPVAGLAPPDLGVPGDFSSAAFAIVAGVLRGDPAVTVTGVNLNPGRTGLLAVLARMGADVVVHPGPDVAGEPSGDVVARRGGILQATEVTGDEVPSMVDELPLVGLLGALAAGTTVVRGAQELRVKESDRGVRSGAGDDRAVGADAEERDDGFAVRGQMSLPGGEVHSHGDHRLAMLGALAGIASQSGVTVHGMEA
ncbi:MAG: 3-phosphoshikimate 1-carboxyvinyltransferase, partial [Miltoncostaeaceae bacterium]